MTQAPSSHATSVTFLEHVKTRADDAAWREFLELYQPLIEGWLRRCGAPAQDASDLCQDVLLKVHQNLRDFDHNGRTGAFRKWMKQIVLHCLTAHRRREARAPQTPGGSWRDLAAEQLEDPHSDLSRRWDQEHDRHVVLQLLSRVASDRSSFEAFRRVALEGESPAEAAAALGMTPGAVAVAKHRILRQLRALCAGLVELPEEA